MDDFIAFLKSRFTEQQIQILALCLAKNVPVSFYGLGLGKSILAAILRNAGFSDVYAPEDCDVDNAQWSVLDRTGAVALCMKKEPLNTSLLKDSFSRDVIRSAISDVLAQGGVRNGSLSEMVEGAVLG